MTCPKCGYFLTDFDAECPRCARAEKQRRADVMHYVAYHARVTSAEAEAALEAHGWDARDAIAALGAKPPGIADPRAVFQHQGPTLEAGSPYSAAEPTQTQQYQAERAAWEAQTVDWVCARTDLDSDAARRALVAHSWVPESVVASWRREQLRRRSAARRVPFVTQPPPPPSPAFPAAPTPAALLTCVACGQPVSPLAPSCPHCGHRVARRTPHPLAIAAYVMAVVGFLILPIVFGPIGIVCGLIAAAQGDTTNGIASAVLCGVLCFLGFVVGAAMMA